MKGRLLFSSWYCLYNLYVNLALHLFQHTLVYYTVNNNKRCQIECYGNMGYLLISVGHFKSAIIFLRNTLILKTRRRSKLLQGAFLFFSFHYSKRPYTL